MLLPISMGMSFWLIRRSICTLSMSMLSTFILRGCCVFIMKMRTIFVVMMIVGLSYFFSAACIMMSSGSLFLTVMLSFMVMHFGLAATVLVAIAACCQGLILLCIQGGKLLKKSNHPPDVGVGHAFAPGWHACGLDTVLDDPEGGSWISINAQF
ncbi:hypothetical protein PVE_P0045 (plasmid) [Pseudomonas veronii 1YdBTEX2]|uniref:Uncharacterized protein n=1 Tax=Pseudomonas veronii 1YdBTEX2 TaxID=1295141 RepID=A0A1D3K9V6_PSEVE|nr:hypothetical protein PVE_P0045 [Pseudomonas veronii 1YdBTEX2]